MAAAINIDAVAKAAIEEVTRACSARLGAEAVSAPADVPAASGLTLTVPVTGAADGRLVIWFDRGSAGAYAGVSVPADLTVLGYRQSTNVTATGGGTSTGYTLQAAPLGGSATWAFDSSDGAIVTVAS